jgi:hypothetical protein
MVGGWAFVVMGANCHVTQQEVSWPGERHLTEVSSVDFVNNNNNNNNL